MHLIETHHSIRLSGSQEDFQGLFMERGQTMSWIERRAIHWEHLKRGGWVQERPFHSTFWEPELSIMKNCQKRRNLSGRKIPRNMNLEKIKEMKASMKKKSPSLPSHQVCKNCVPIEQNCGFLVKLLNIWHTLPMWRGVGDNLEQINIGFKL